MNILSVQSSVSYGSVGNTVASFALQRLGHHVWPIATVSFSNHPGFGAWRGRVTPAAELASLLDGLEAIGALGRCDSVLTGYLGSVENGEACLNAVARVRAANPAAVFCCDTVMGSQAKGLYVDPDLPAFFRNRALPMADLLIANSFEAEKLTGHGLTSLEAARAAAQDIRARGPGLVVVTGLRRGERVASIAMSSDGGWLADSPYIEQVADDGAGDLFAALFVGRYLENYDAPAALTHAVAAVHDVVAATRDAGADALDFVTCQDFLLSPTGAGRSRPLA